MNRLIRCFSIMMAVPLVLAGCFGSSTPRDRVRYYTLEYNPPAFKDLVLKPCVIKIQRFSINPIYNTTRIVYQDESGSTDDYVYYRWRANPADMATQLLERDFRNSGVIKAVLDADSRFPYTHTLEGSVDEFLESDSGKTWHAILTISITLMKEDGLDIVGGILLQKTYNMRKELEKNNPRALAEAMSKAMSGISEKIIRDVYSCIEEPAQK